MKKTFNDCRQSVFFHLIKTCDIMINMGVDGTCVAKLELAAVELGPWDDI